MRRSVVSGCQECHWSFTRDYPQLVASTTMWEIETNSVGSGSDPGIVGPGQVRYVGSPPRGIDRTLQFASTKPPTQTGVVGRDWRKVSWDSVVGVDSRARQA